MVQLASPQLPLYARSRYALPPIASITVRRFPNRSIKSFPWHEPVAWQPGSHRRLKRAGWPNYTFAFHDNEEVGPGLLAQIAKKTGLKPDNL